MLIDTQSISKSYGARVLFSCISLTFFDEERLGLIGPNGSGKSTLLKILAGLEEPDSGTVFRRRGLSMAHVFQGDRLDLERTIEGSLRNSLPEEPWRKRKNTTVSRA